MGRNTKIGVSYHSGFRVFLLKLGIFGVLSGFLWYNFRVTRRFQVFLGWAYGFIVTPQNEVFFMSTANWYNTVHSAAEKAGIELSKTKSEAFARALADALHETLSSGEDVSIQKVATFKIDVAPPTMVRAGLGTTELKPKDAHKVVKISQSGVLKKDVAALPVSKAEEKEAIAKQKERQAKDAKK